MATGKEVPRSPSAENSRWLSEPEQSWGGKPVLLEETKHLDSEAAAGGSGQEEACAKLALSTPSGKLRLRKPPTKVCWGQGHSSFIEVPWLKKTQQGRQAQGNEHHDLKGQPGSQQLTQDIPREPADSTVFSAWSSRAQREQRNAFSKPARCPSGRPGSASVFQAGRPVDALGEQVGLIKVVDIPCWGCLFNARLLVNDFWDHSVLPQIVPLCSAILGSSTLWLRHAMAQISTPLSSSSAASAFLQPTFTSLGMPTQNWCAKCNLSFRLIDLVFNMRSHHKKEHAEPGLHSNPLTEETLTCPICHEYFCERHHLSRHMTSHH
ncbi:LOW QUALITY PROTEIN: zinc finger protein 488 [Rhynchonycteris naso]